MHASRGFSLIEVLLAALIVLLGAMIGVMQVTRTSQHINWSRDKAYARQKAVSILDELRSYVEGGEGEVASDLDGFDDGVSQSPVLTITADPLRPGHFVEPDHPVSGNVLASDQWSWFRRITVRPVDGSEARDLRLATVRVYRAHAGEELPGTQMAEVSSVIRTIGDAYPTTQVYDVYLLALENAPGWWVYMDAIQPFIEATLTDLESRNRGLQFRTHWITKLGYGRDEEYAPYSNEARASTDTTPWTYVYPGRMPAGESSLRYYVAGRMGARINLDGQTTPAFSNDYASSEPYTDSDGDGQHDSGEIYTDENGNGCWDAGNAAPYALADMHNHCMRWPAATARHDARVAAGLDTDEEPTWRLLLDRMVAEPERYHNAILVNLHGELLPVPPARNVSDAAKSPEDLPGWRAVTHPDLLRPARVQGQDAASDAPSFRVYAWKASFEKDEPLTAQAEPYLDANGNGQWDTGEDFRDWNGDGAWSAGVPISVVVEGGDFAYAPNAGSTASIRIRRLSGGIDADADGSADPYVDWADAPHYPEAFQDSYGNGIREVVEPYLDLNGDGVRDWWEPHQELDGNGFSTSFEEALEDGNADGHYDPARPAEPYTDSNGNGRWDGAEPLLDVDGNGEWTAPQFPELPWQPWDPANLQSWTAYKDYLDHYGEPFADLNGNGVWDGPEDLYDTNANGVWDGGFERGEMWFGLQHVAGTGTVVSLHGTPLETPFVSATGTGLPADYRLYDLDYVPCPTPEETDGADRFARDLASSGDDVPKNTARWTLELPLAAVRRAFASSPSANDGDASDRILTVHTRLGRDLTTGSMWPVRHVPPNRSTVYAYFYADPADVPYSERYQFMGDPRHAPYADTDARGSTASNGYNWYFDNFTADGKDSRDKWRAFDTGRLRDAWKGNRGSAHDVPRLMTWLRQAVVRSESIYTTLTGFSYYYLSVGGDVGFDSANGYANSIPMDGTPFGLTGEVFENTITTGGPTAAIRGSLKYVRTSNGTSSGVRDGGYWWSKPWLGELYPDASYAGQWKPWGNLRAATGSAAGTHRLVRRGDITTSQQPRGTHFVNAYARLANEGCTSFFNIGASSRTFHHQFADGATGQLVDDGPQLAENYNFPMPQEAPISRPFGLSTNSSGGVGDEFSYTDAYPRYSASIVRRFYDHAYGQTGSALVRLDEPGADSRSGYVVVNGVDKTLGSGSAFIARYSVLSLLHGFFAGGAPGVTNRIRQVPRVEMMYPTLISELDDPSTIEVRWSSEWTRWDGRPYTEAYAEDFAENDADVVYVPLYSRDGGRTWLNMISDERAEIGVMPWIDGVGPNPALTLRDRFAGADETWAWPTPRERFPQGSYLVRIEAYRASETLHYAHHVEKIHVGR